FSDGSRVYLVTDFKPLEPLVRILDEVWRTKEEVRQQLPLVSDIRRSGSGIDIPSLGRPPKWTHWKERLQCRLHKTTTEYLQHRRIGAKILHLASTGEPFGSHFFG